MTAIKTNYTVYRDEVVYRSTLVKRKVVVV